MKVLELFAGSCSFSKAARKLGHETFTTDWRQYTVKLDLIKDINQLEVNDLKDTYYDFIWASPPCTAFSVASCGKNWTPPPNRSPKSANALRGLKMVKKTIDLINELKPRYWVIENPRGILRKLDIVKDLNKTTVSYCQYGDERMKPTDLWHNLVGIWDPKPMCNNGDTCHVSAPRGSATGTQGLKSNYYRSQVPQELCLEILNAVGALEEFQRNSEGNPVELHA